MSGAFMLLLWTAGALTAGFLFAAVLAFRDLSARGTIDVLLRSAVVMIIAVLGWTWLDYSILRERLAERRALDARTSELIARAIAPGSALACLNLNGNETVAAACEQAVFASPQAVAAAIAYIDAKLVLLADGVDYASRDRTYAAELDQPRRALEADRFGIVAHVLAGRGCKSDDCAAFKLLKDASRVQANLKDRAFEAVLTGYASNWPSANPPTASVAPLPTAVVPQPGPPVMASVPAPAMAPPPPNTPIGPKYTLPSASSIPAVSIMAPEPTTPPNASETPSERPAPPRRQTDNKPPPAPSPAPAKPLPAPPRATPPIATVPPPNSQ